MEEDLKEASASVSDIPRRSGFAPHPSAKKSGKLKKLIMIVGIILLLSAASYAIWNFFISDDRKISAPSTQSETKKPAPEISNDEVLKDHESAGLLSIDFKYPISWDVTENDGGVTAKSANFKYKTVDNKEVDGYFKVYVRKGARAVDSKYIAKGYASRDSQKLEYKDPALGQIKSTLLQTFSYDKPTDFSFFFLASNFNLKVGDTLGPNYGKEPETILVVGGFSDASLTDDLAMNTVPVDKYENYKAYKQALSIVQSLQYK